MLRVEATSNTRDNMQAIAADRALREKATEFEGMLIAQILQKLEECYKLDSNDVDDSTSQSFQSLATSAVGGGLARSGGLGIGELIVQSLRGREPGGVEAADSKGT